MAAFRWGGLAFRRSDAGRDPGILSERRLVPERRPASPIAGKETLPGPTDASRLRGTGNVAAGPVPAIPTPGWFCAILPPIQPANAGGRTPPARAEPASDPEGKTICWT